VPSADILESVKGTGHAYHVEGKRWAMVSASIPIGPTVISFSYGKLVVIVHKSEFEGHLTAGPAKRAQSEPSV